MEQKLMEKDSLRMQEEIENAMYIAREKSLADVKYYQTMKEAEENKLKLTPQFLELKFIEAISNITKMFFGNKIPNMLMDQRVLGNFLRHFKGRNVSYISCAKDCCKNVSNLLEI
ncbi:hypothetical protein Hanom_Chr06g00552321 [Helianthus anomalus]